MPLLGANIHRLAALLLFPWPASVRRWLLERVLGFPPHAVATTLSFLASRDGIWQALHLARDELQRITRDLWPEELWEVASESADRVAQHPRFYMFYGENDHWVANKHRDDLISRKAERSDRGDARQGRARIVVDDGGLPHAFCFGTYGYLPISAVFSIKANMVAYKTTSKITVRLWQLG